MMKKKKIIFTVLIFGLLFFVFNAGVAKAGDNCLTFCKEKCPLTDTDGNKLEHYDDTTCRKVGAKGEGYLCSCCTCEYLNQSVNEDVKCECWCQAYSGDDSSGNHITDCYTGGLFQSWRTSVCLCCGDCTLNDLLYIGVSVAELILKYLGVIALALFVLGGIIWITSGGSKDKVQKGAAIIKGAIIGMIIVIVAFSVVRVIMKDILKVDQVEMPGSIPESSSIEHRIS